MTTMLVWWTINQTVTRAVECQDSELHNDRPLPSPSPVRTMIYNCCKPGGWDVAFPNPNYHLRLHSWHQPRSFLIINIQSQSESLSATPPMGRWAFRWVELNGYVCIWARYLKRRPWGCGWPKWNGWSGWSLWPEVACCRMRFDRGNRRRRTGGEAVRVWRLRLSRTPLLFNVYRMMLRSSDGRWWCPTTLLALNFAATTTYLVYGWWCCSFAGVVESRSQRQSKEDLFYFPSRTTAILTILQTVSRSTAG